MRPGKVAFICFEFDRQMDEARSDSPLTLAGLRAFYAEVNPGKVDEVEEIYAYYSERGTLGLLEKRLQERYGEGGRATLKKLLFLSQQQLAQQQSAQRQRQEQQRHEQQRQERQQQAQQQHNMQYQRREHQQQAAGADGGGDVMHDEEVNVEVFDGYCPSIMFGRKHPGKVCESRVLASVRLPPLTYPCDGIQHMLDQDLLSSLQLEGVLFACQKHLSILPSGERAGFFIGDGAGVGKGRQLAAIIAESTARGRRKHLWFSVSADLTRDARRDFDDIGCRGINIIDGCRALDRKKVFSDKTSEGVIFSTYASLTSQSRGSGKRLEQMLAWCSGRNGQASSPPLTSSSSSSAASSSNNMQISSDFNGVIVFDECHKAKNVHQDEKKSSKVALAVLALQRRLPKARVVYASATGCSEVSDLAFMTRLGLWGPGTSFTDFAHFLGSMEKRGLGGLEVLAMELKSSGRYCARGLSWEGAEFSIFSATLSDKVRALYDRCTEWWADLLKELKLASRFTGNTSGLKVYWGAHLRFFRGLVTSLKVPFVVDICRRALAKGQCPVIGLQSTGEAGLDFAANTMGAQRDSEIEAGLLSPSYWSAWRFVEEHGRLPLCNSK